MPDWKPPLTARLTSLRLDPAREQEIIDELSQHLDDLYRERREAGDPHDEAMRRALDEIDERDLLAREMRPLHQARYSPPPAPGTRSANWIIDLTQDLRYAGRTLVHTKGWALVIVLLLAIGIGANTALFRATDALLFSSLPVKDPEALVRLRWTGQNDAITERAEYGLLGPLPDGRRVGGTFSHAVFTQLVESAGGTVDLFACAPFSQLTVVIDGQAELASGLAATGNYFTVLGVDARLGRLFTEQDDQPGAAPVAVISSRYWLTRFGGDRSVLGKVIRINDVPVTIVGIEPPAFTGVQRTLSDASDIAFPLSLDEQLKASSGRADRPLSKLPTAWWLQVMGRLAPATTTAQVQARLDGVFQQATRAGLSAYLQSLTDEQRATSSNRERRQVPQLLVEEGRRGLFDADEHARQQATILNAIVVVLLLIVCANVANLMLSRAIARRREISLRVSLGATRGRLLRQLFTEALVLASLGAALGLVVAHYGVRLLPPPAANVDVFQGRSLAFTALAAILTSLVFGAVPALRATRLDVNTGLKETTRSASARRSVLARSLLVVQVALSLVLLVGAGLFLQTLEHLRRVDVGFDPNNLLLVRVTPGLSGYDQTRTTELYRTLLDRFSVLPGVEGASLSQPALLSGSISSTEIYVEGGTDVSRGEESPEIYYQTVSPTFFDVMRIPLVAGRTFTEGDNPSSPRVALINETAARKYFAGDNPIGKRFGSRPDRRTHLEVIGIVRDTKYASLREPSPPTMYVSHLQSPRAAGVFELRTVVDPLGVAPAVREAVRQMDPNLPLADVSTQLQQIERRFSQEKLFARAYMLFGALALVLAAIGLFGLMSYNVARRTAEMGIRMALGAQRLHVVRMVMRESLVLVGVGVLAGVAVALASGRLVSALLFNVPPHDAWSVAGAAMVMALVSALAAYLPARRAAHVDPIVALRNE